MAQVLEEKETAIPEFDLEGYVTKNPVEVLAFLEKHPVLPSLLAEALSPARQVFGKDARINLSVLEDHDGNDDVRLIAGILTADSVVEARDLRTQFHRGWWNANTGLAKNRLFLDVEFVDG